MIVGIPQKCVWAPEIDVMVPIWIPIGGGLWFMYYVYIKEEKLKRFRGMEKFLIFNPN